MEAKTDGKINGCVILWTIENLSHCWLKKDEEIRSPTFVVESLKWYLSFLPNWNFPGHVKLSLYRESRSSGPHRIDAIYQLALLHKDGSFLKVEKWESGFYTGGSGWSLHEKRGKIFGSHREAFLSDDTLTAQCIIWNVEKASVQYKEIFAHTVLNLKCRYFVWKIGNFSCFGANLRNKFKDDLVEFDFVLNEGTDFEMKLAIDVISFDESIKYFALEISVINSKRKKEHYGTFEYFECDLKKEILPKTLSTRMLIENKSKYLPDDILSLDCKCIYSTGTIADQFCSEGMLVSLSNEPSFWRKQRKFCR